MSLVDELHYSADSPDYPETVCATVDTPQHSGQLRMAYRLAAQHRDRLLHVHAIGWHYWDGTRWVYDDMGAAKRAVVDVLRGALAESLGDKELRADVRRCESAAGVAGVLDLASALEPFAATARDLDADPHLLNVANGTLDLRTMELSRHDPADRLTKICRAAYETNVNPGPWQEFLATVLPVDEVRGYVQRHAGVALLGKVVEHVLSIWTGTGANGKGTAYGAFCWALGDYACTAEPELFLHRQGGHPTGEMDLMGRRLVVVSETDEGRRFAEATMKRLTGGDTIRARRMRQDFIEFTPSHTAVLVTNHLPAVSGDDPAVWRRIRVVPWDVVVPEDQRDGELPARLERAAEEVLAWCIAGWSEYRRIGLAEPDAVLTSTDAYRADSDAVARFIADECVTSSPALKATTGQLFDAWQAWRVSDGAPEISQKKFGQRLDIKGYPVTDKARDGRWREGIGLKVVEP
ncbi:phage/plasmid primase, P4 family [Mycobacterium sp. OTB74]|jgi:putative DNA primase/helicase|uniref:DNA primase family protein n=1 Tax=Mycobacterium sp. OTB74 TaxID=1853452 RepID=UPI0024765E04|nr:phage/plasmid primase, P4 family [Mycobacterium sp. OTB74]MDH6247251.1 putative DNA primase/helicase [Mycobacterium sp. OTB74]